MSVRTTVVAVVAPARHCAWCGAVAPCIGSTSERFEWIPGGTEYEFRCSSCGKTFIVESIGRLIFSTLAGTALAIVGWAWASETRHEMPPTVGWGALTLAIGVTVHGVFKARLRWRCPIVKG